MIDDLHARMRVQSEWSLSDGEAHLVAGTGDGRWGVFRALVERAAKDGDGCGSPRKVKVAESPSQMRVTVRRPDVMRFGGGDCQDIAILTLDAPLASRELVDATGTTLPVSTAVPGQGDEADWPWDPDRFTVDDYNAALQAMVQCLETEDPDMTAWVTEDLNWDTYAWDKAPVNGNVSAPAIETCQTRHLDPLT